MRRDPGAAGGTEARGPWDPAEHEAAIRRLAWVLDLLIRIETATAPAAVRASLRALAAGGAEPNRWVLRRARARLAAPGARSSRPGGPAAPERSDP